jgi:hypothetical protein
MKWPLGAPAAVRKKGAISQQDETEERDWAALAERALTLSVGTLGAATLNGPPYSWSFVRQDQGELVSHTIIVFKTSLTVGISRRTREAATLGWHSEACEGIEGLHYFD